MLERDWIRVVGHRDVPGKPEMFGTTKQFLDYFGLKSIDQLPVLAEIRDQGPEAFPQTDFIEGLEVGGETVAHADSAEPGDAEADDESGGMADELLEDLTEEQVHAEPIMKESSESV